MAYEKSSNDEEYVIRNIARIYRRFAIDRNLRKHMFYVAGVGAFICRHWKGKRIDDKLVISSLLVHDLGNIVKYYGIRSKKLLLLKNKFVKKYGKNAHSATIKMLKEIGIRDSRLLSVVRAITLDSLSSPEIVKSKDWEKLICMYSDWRVSPKGVVSLDERFDYFMQRYRIEEERIIATMKVVMGETAW